MSITERFHNCAVYQLLTRADKTPCCEHEQRYNSPNTNEAAVILAGEITSKKYSDLPGESHLKANQWID